MQGKIIRGVAGFYYVYVNGTGIYECKAKGIFRKDSKKPLVGDDVAIDILDEKAMLGNIREILPRHSELVRPTVANVDQALVVFSIVKPKPRFFLLDRFLVIMQRQEVPCIICFNKSDLDVQDIGCEYERIYAHCGCRTLIVSAHARTGMEELMDLLKDKTTAMAGPSGVGKSSIVNCLQTDVIMETRDISPKIERGRHTTRHSEIIAINRDTYVLDTPGFSTLDLLSMEKEELSACYPEFTPYEKECRFHGCSHIDEPDCGVKEAVQKGDIHKIRYENYCQLYEELKNKKKY